MKKLTVEEKKVSRLLQYDIQLVNRPFDIIAESCGLSTVELINIIQKLRQEGFMRKFGAVLRQQRVGYTKNALIVWSVLPHQIEKVGKTLSSFSFISHCYERNPAFRTKYNLFTMLHIREKDIISLVKKTADSIGIDDYLILESLQEYKKTSPEYF